MWLRRISGVLPTVATMFSAMFIVVEFWGKDEAGSMQNVIPVEYKAGQPKKDSIDKIQLCAQALCLEEMLSKPVTEGAIYSIQTKRRREVPFDDELRDATQQVIAEVRDMLFPTPWPPPGGGKLPPALTDRNKCRNCSLFDACVPDTVLAARAAWHKQNLFRVEAT